jgi:hypothetical protein
MQKLYFFSLISLSFCWFTQLGFAQGEADYAQARWHNGQVELASGQTLSGKLKYQINQNVVLLKQNDGTLQTLNSWQIKNFSFYDTLRKTQRRFCTLAHPNPRSTKDALFLEVVYEGFISLMSYEKTRLQAYPEDGNQKWRKPGYYVADDVFYLVDMTGKMQKYTGLEKIAPIMGETPLKMRQFIQTHQLNLNKRQDFKFLVEHYNQIISRRLNQINEEVDNP